MNRDTRQTGLSEAVQERLRAVFATCPGVQEVILYGSRAKGTAQSRSDIDLVLRGPDLTHRDLSSLANKLDDLLLPQKIDLAIDSQIDNPALRDHLNRVGILLFAREETS